jgi:hypothetical protein
VTTVRKNSKKKEKKTTWMHLFSWSAERVQHFRLFARGVTLGKFELLKGLMSVAM